MDTSGLIENVRRAMSLDRSFYREAAADGRYGQQALTVVIIVAILTGAGSFLGAMLGGNFFGAFVLLLVSIVMAIVGYYIWAYVIQWVGAQFFQGKATAPELLRTLGFAYAPNALAVLSFIPCVGGLIALIGAIWSLVCGFFAVRDAHQLDDGKTLLTVIIGWVIVMIVVAVVTGIVGLIFGITGAGLNMLMGR